MYEIEFLSIKMLRKGQYTWALALTALDTDFLWDKGLVGDDSRSELDRKLVDANKVDLPSFVELKQEVLTVFTGDKLRGAESEPTFDWNSKFNRIKAIETHE